MQHERNPLGGRELFEYHEQGQAHRVGQECFPLGTASVQRAADHLGRFRIQRLLSPRCAGPEHVQADAGEHRRQPAAEVRDRADIGPAEAEPGFLDRIFRLTRRAEHTVGDPLQVRTMRLESRRQVQLLAHRSHPLVLVRHGSEVHRPSD